MAVVVGKTARQRCNLSEPQNPGDPPTGIAGADPLIGIAGIGPATAEGFARAGITTAAQMRAIGADGAYAAWLRASNPPHFIGYYALVMALQGRPWNDCRGAEKSALRAKFDALKAQNGPSLAARPQKGRPENEAAPGMDVVRNIEAALDQLGLGLRREMPPQTQASNSASASASAGAAQPTSSRPEKK